MSHDEIAAARRISGLTIACDHCERVATWRSETRRNYYWFDVHWTCEDHK